MAGEGICQGTEMLYYQMILSQSQLSVGGCCQGTRDFVSLENYLDTARGQFKTKRAFLLTARQYGEVVLPDASTGQGPGTLSQKAVTVQGGYGALFAVLVQVLLSITSVAVQV